MFRKRDNDPLESESDVGQDPKSGAQTSYLALRPIWSQRFSPKKPDVRP